MRKPGAPLGTRCEIKNVNSIRFVMQAIEYEARRQVEVIEDGGAVEQETRLFDAGRGIDALDALQGGCARLPLFPRSGPAAAGARCGLGRGAAQGACPSCRTPRRRASSRDYGLTPYDAGVLVAERATADYFEAVAKGRDAKLAANWVMGDLFGALEPARPRHRAIAGDRRGAGRAARPDADGTISGRIAKDVFAAMVETRQERRGDRRGEAACAR